MAYDGSLNFNTEVDSSGFNNGLKEIENTTKKRMGNFGGSFWGTFLNNVISKGFDMIVGSVDKAMSRLDTMAQFSRVMETMTGSAELTASALEEVNSVVSGTAFGLDTAASGVQNFVSAGMEVSKATETISAWGDAVAFYTKGTNSELATVENALQKMQTKGNVTMEHLQMLLEAGIPAVQIYADAVGTSTEEVINQMSKGELKTEDFINVMNDAFSTGTSGFPSIAGAAKEAGSSWSGSIDNMQAAITRGVASIIDSFDSMYNVKSGMVKFGKAIESVLKGIGENLDVIVPLIAGVATAFAAWKFSKVIMGVVNAFQLLAVQVTLYSMQLGGSITLEAAEAVTLTAKETIVAVLTGKMTLATAAQYAWNAAMNANPIGVIVVAITAAVTAIGILISTLGGASEEMENLASESEEMVQQNDSLIDSIGEMEENFKSSDTSAQKYADIIDKLGSKSNRTASEQYQLEYAIEQLNDVYPELNLSIEECNNGLSQQAKNTIKASNATEKYKLAQEKQIELNEAIAEAEFKIEEAEKQRAAELAELSQSDLRQIELMEQTLDAGGDVTGMYLGLSEKAREYMNGEDEYNRILSEQNGIIATNTAENERLNETYSIQKLQLEELGVDVTNLSQAEVENIYNQIQGIEDINTKLTELDAAYITARDTALQSIQSQTEGFKTLTAESGMSVDTVTSNLNTNTEFLNNFSTNLENLKSRDIPGFNEMLSTMDLSTEDNMANINEWATYSDEDIQKMVEAWEKEKEAEERAAEQIGLTATNYEEEYTNIVTTAQTAVNNLDLSGEAKTAGENTIQGLIDGLESKKSLVSATAEKIADTAITAMKNKLQIHSPSKIFKKLGMFTMEGFVLGADSEETSVVEKFSNIAKIAAQQMKAAIDYNQMKVVADMPVLATVPAGSQSAYTSNFTQIVNSPVALSPAELTREATDAQKRQKWQLP